MSRDAKVGLVIISSFVVLVGTIVAHRVRLTAGESPGPTEPVVTETDGTGSGSEGSGALYSLTETGGPPTTVDATVDESDLNRTESAALRDLRLSERQRKDRSSKPSWPPSDSTATRSDTEMISLTESETSTQQRAAVIESGTGGVRSNRTDSNRRNTRDSEDYPTGRTSPLLDIRSSSSNSIDSTSRPRELPAQFSGNESHESNTVRETDETSTTGDIVANDESTTVDATTAETDQVVEEQFSPKDRRSAERLSANGADVDDVESVQQTGGKRRPPENTERRSQENSERPPQLPEFGSRPQATIEAIASRPRPQIDDASMQPNTAPRSKSSRQFDDPPSDPAEDAAAAQKLYVVREGDSFWSISAKHYGTGKYFRALEEFNRHRLAAYSDGRTILRPGTEILLPDVAQLRTKGSTPKSTADVTRSDERDGNTSRYAQGKSADRQPFDTRPTASRGSTEREERPTTYRVQDGDSLSVIAQRELGTSRRWPEIYELNREKLANERSLTIGMELKLPPFRPTERLVDRPTDGR